MIGINFVQQTNVDESSISRKTSQYWSGQHHVGGQLFPISQILYLSAVRMVSVFSGQCLSVWILSVSILSVVQVLFGFLEPADMGKDAKKQRSVTHPSSPRIWPVSKGCPNFPDRSVRCLVSVLILCSVSVCRVSVYPDSVCLDSVRILPGCFEKTLSAVCLSDQTRTKRTVRKFDVLIRQRPILPISWIFLNFKIPKSSF